MKYGNISVIGCIVSTLQLLQLLQHLNHNGFIIKYRYIYIYFLITLFNLKYKINVSSINIYV